MKRIVLILFFMSQVPFASAFIYDLTVLDGINPRTGKEQRFLGCSDYHDKSHALTNVQLATIEQKLAECNPRTTHVYTEDLSSRSDDGKSGCGRFMVKSQGGILGGLTRKCQLLGLAIDNIEYRFCRVAAISPVLNNLEADLFSFPSVYTTHIADLVAEIKQVMHEVRNYNDGIALNSYYAESLHEISQQLGELALTNNSTLSVAQFLNSRVPSTKRMHMLRLLLTFDSVLLDLKLVHRFVNSDKNAIAFTGGSHIERVSNVLEKILKFKYVQPSRKQMVREYDPQKCIGTTMVHGRYCIKPAAVATKDFDIAFKAFNR
jgi:hypothetical protein